MFREPKPGFTEVMEVVKSIEPDYCTIKKIQEKIGELYQQHKAEYKETVLKQGLDWETEKRNDPWKGIYPYKFAEYRDAKGRYVPFEKAKAEKASIWVFRESDWTIMESDQKQSGTTKDPEHPNFRYYVPLHPITGKPCAMPSRGWKGTRYIDPKYPNRNSLESLTNDHRIAYGKDESKVPQQKRFLHEVEFNVAKSIFVDYADGEKETSAIFGRKGVFLAPKHTDFVARFILQASNRNSHILDIFGGSGSTGGAVISTNRIDEGTRKYILMETNRYFDTIIKPRMLKTVYALKWKNGKPVSRDGISHAFKYIRLESYEDTLNNLSFKDDAARDQALQSNDDFRRDYMLKYWLEFETKSSPSLLNIEQFDDPTAYMLTLKKPGSDEYEEKSVDLVESFNWLIGLHVDHLDMWRNYNASFKREPDPELPSDDGTRLIIDGRMNEADDGKWLFRKIEGRVCRTPGDMNNTDHVLVIWRKLTGNLEEDNLMLDEWFKKYRLSTKDSKFDVIYVNGSNNLPNLRQDDEHWKVRLIEEAFHQQMWDVNV